jgi:hypothetical protein
MRIAILSAALASCALASVPVRDGCTEDSVLVATVQDNDAIQVQHGVVGETVPCYAVSVTQQGHEIRGYIQGSTLPVIQEFERRRALESRVMIPAPPPPPLAPGEQKPTAPAPTGPPFEPWTGVDIKGRRMQIAAGDSKVTLVTFWSAESGPGRRAAENLMKTESEFRAKGLVAYGLVQAISPGRLGYYLDDMGLDYRQAIDRQRLAAKYNADPAKGTTLVISASNHIVAVSSNPAEIRAAIVKLLSSE